VLAHAQKPDFVFQGNGRVHLNWPGGGGVQFSRLLAAEVCASAVVMVVMLDTQCSEVECKTTGYPPHSHVSPSLPLPCVTVCHQVSTTLYQQHLFSTTKCATVAKAMFTFGEASSHTLNYAPILQRALRLVPPRTQA